jgi:hypothetical protein
MEEIENLNEERKSKKLAKDKKTLRYFLLGLAGFLLIGVVASVTGYVDDVEPSVAPVDPQIALWQNYQDKVMADIAVMAAEKDCDSIFNEIRVAEGMQFDKGPRGWANKYIYNIGYSEAVSAGCDMTEIYK